MLLLALLLNLAPPWVESADFPREKQEAALKATVRITNPQTGGQGTGVMVKKEGDFVYILTANHVVEKCPKANVQTYIVDKKLVQKDKFEGVRIEVRMEQIDLAVLKIEVKEAPSMLPICPNEKAQKKGFPTLTVGCTHGMWPEIWLEEVENSVIRRDKPTGQSFGLHWKTSRESKEGRSGGPMIDASGYLIGICKGKDNDRGYYLHVKEIREGLEKAGWKKLLE